MPFRAFRGETGDDFKSVKIKKDSYEVINSENTAVILNMGQHELVKIILRLKLFLINLY